MKEDNLLGKFHMLVGLGNKGKEYENTRHNVGVMCLDYIVQKESLKY